MTTEVSCGQCQGRLLVETLGIVVACPHCGTHLSIPAPEPVPAITGGLTSPAPEAHLLIPGPEPVPAPSPAESQPSPPADPLPKVLDAVPAAVVFAAVDELNSSSVHEGSDDQPANPAQVGWPSAPNLYLAPESPAVPAVDAAVAQQPALFTAPLMDRDDVRTTEMTDACVAKETTVQMLAPAAHAEFPLSASQQFSLGAPASEAAAATPAPRLQFAAATAVPVFSAAPSAAAPPAGPLTFGAAPAAVPPAPLTFGAAPAGPPPTPLTFGAAPPVAPSAHPSFAAAPPQSSPVQAPHLPSSTVAQDAAAFAENEFESRQKFMTMLLIIVGSYASAVTLVLIYVLIAGRASNLESLPDLKPQVGKNGDIIWSYNIAKNDVPSGHVLSLGQSRRFGNIKVTPIKVTRGIVKFEHYTGQKEMARDPSAPVLKLWVKFENVSRDQTIAPLDAYLLFTRKSINLGETIQANGFVAAEPDRRLGKSVSRLFDMPVHSEHRMIGQNLNRELPPGETLQTFIPSEEDALNLKGDLVWRFQFRKGYSRAKLGVTTLIDVRFKSSDIKEERGTT